jgi:hypothetical protein
MMKKEQNEVEPENPALRVGGVNPRFFEYRGLDRKKRKIEIPESAWKIHITWGSDLSSKGVFLWYMLNGDWKLHCLSRTRWMHKLNHFTQQLERWQNGG